MTRKKSPTISSDRKLPYGIRLRRTMMDSLNKASIHTGLSKGFIVEIGTGKEIKRLLKNCIDNGVGKE